MSTISTLKQNQKLRILLMFLVCFSASKLSFAQFNGGTGTLLDPFQIATVTQLQAMNTGLDKHYILTQNIDASATSTWNNGDGFAPIGLTTAAAFVGTFDGKGYVISKLYINKISGSGVGLFGNAFNFTTTLPSIMNVGLDSVYVKGATRVGALVGNKELIVVNCFSTGVVIGSGESIGGLIGRNGNIVDNCYSNCTVTGASKTGGLIGSGANVRNSYASGAVHGIGEVGGLIGGVSNSGGVVYNCYATGSVLATGNFPSVGGLIGRLQNGTVDLCYATGAINAENAAGLVYQFDAGIIKRSYSTSIISTTSSVFTINLSGFVGQNKGTIQDCYTLAKINYPLNSTGSVIAGFTSVNEDRGEIYNSYASVRVNSPSTIIASFVHNNKKSSNNLDTGVVKNCYYNLDTAGAFPGVVIDDGGLVVVSSLTDVLMRKRNSFATWNFDTTWNNIENQTYPFIRTPMAPCQNTSAIDSVRACAAYTWINGITYTANNDTTKFILPNATGCDSIVTLHLTIDTIDVNVTLTQFTLSAAANNANATYQWIDCANNTAITAATSASFTAINNGSYAVIVSNGLCVDTSVCTTVVVTGVENNKYKELNMYPNPTANNIYFELIENAEINILDAMGRVVFASNVAAGAQSLALSNFENGLYLLLIKGDHHSFSNKIILSK